MWGGFIFGLPYDYFNNMNDHSGIEINKFCIKNKIGVQPTCFTDLPGSRDFLKSQRDNKFLYGKIGTMDYLVSLCLCDAREGNRIIDSIKLNYSPLVVAYMAHNTAQKVGSTYNAIKNGIYMSKKAWRFPTKKGTKNLNERFFDSFAGFGSQIAVALEKENHDVIAYSTKYHKGSFERLFEMEKNTKIKNLFKDYIKKFKQ